MGSSTQSPEFIRTDTAAVPVSKKMLWAGRIIGAIPVLLLLFSGAVKVMKAPPVLQGFVRYGYQESQIIGLGVLEIFCCVVYAIPRTAILGAILMTGYLGGATASNVRIGDPSYFLTVILGVLVWLGLFLRDARLRALLPLRS